MRIATGLLLLFFVLSISSRETTAEDNLDDVDDLDDGMDDEDETISTRLDNTALRNVEAMNGDNATISTASIIEEVSAPHFVNSSVSLHQDGTTSTTTTREEDGAEKPEALPEALELRYARPGKYSSHRRPAYFAPKPPARRTPVNRRNVYHHDKPSRSSSVSARPPRRPNDPKRAPTEAECTFFSKTVCLEAVDYPIEAIMRSIRNNKEMVTALLADFKVPESGFYDDDDDVPPAYKDPYDSLRYTKKKKTSPHNNNINNNYDRFETGNEIKRKFEFNSYGDLEEGYTCQSQVRYARPQLARAASGVWKYIINTGDHTQTLRLEKCVNPKSSCSFISENYRSSCHQVYNYHRLLTWDSKLGLHMDIFKVPSCCSCHVHGYTDLYPPHQTDPPIKAQETFPGADFAQNDHQGPVKFGNSLDSSALNLFKDNYGLDPDEHQLQHSSSARRPSVVKPPNGGRPRKQSNPPKPFAKLPQQHAPNTRAPGYKGPRPYRPSRPFRRESAASDVSDYSENSGNITLNRFSQQAIEQQQQQQDAIVPSVRLQNGGFDDEAQDPSKPINYNYHYIIDFFKPEAAMLKSEVPAGPSSSSQQSSAQEPMQASASTASLRLDHDSWKPILKP